MPQIRLPIYRLNSYRLNENYAIPVVGRSVDKLGHRLQGLPGCFTIRFVVWHQAKELGSIQFG